MHVEKATHGWRPAQRQTWGVVSWRKLYQYGVQVHTETGEGGSRKTREPISQMLAFHVAMLGKRLILQGARKRNEIRLSESRSPR